MRHDKKKLDTNYGLVLGPPPLGFRRGVPYVIIFECQFHKILLKQVIYDLVLLYKRIIMLFFGSEVV